MDEIQKRLGEGRLDGTELAWHEGLDEWVNVKEAVEGEVLACAGETLIELEAATEAEPLDEEESVGTEVADEEKPLDDDPAGQVRKIRELIGAGHADTAWQLVQSLNNPAIYEGLLEDCPVDKDGWVSVPEFLHGGCPPSFNGDLFIKLLLNLPETAQVRSELHLLRQLDYSSQYADVMIALGELTYLTELNLSYNNLTDEHLKHLAKLTQLTALFLGNNHYITDVSALAGLTQLKELGLEHNQLTDASVLAELTQLTSLNLEHNQISDVSPLAELTQLKMLAISFNQITDMSALAGLTQLTDLEIAFNKITDVSALAGLVQLTKLNLNRNRITDGSVLKGLKQLRYLYIDNGLTKDQAAELREALPKCSIYCPSGGLIS